MRMRIAEADCLDRTGKPALLVLCPLPAVVGERSTRARKDESRGKQGCWHFHSDHGVSPLVAGVATQCAWQNGGPHFETAHRRSRTGVNELFFHNRALVRRE